MSEMQGIVVLKLSRNELTCLMVKLVPKLAAKRASHLDSDHTNLWKMCWKTMLIDIVVCCGEISDDILVAVTKVQKHQVAPLHIFQAFFEKLDGSNKEHVAAYLKSASFQTKSKNRKKRNAWAFCQTLSALILLYPCLKVSAGHLSRTTSRILAKRRCASETGNGRFCDYNYGDFTENFRDLTEAE